MSWLRMHDAYRTSDGSQRASSWLAPAAFAATRLAMKWLQAASAELLAALAGGMTNERPVRPLWVSLTGSGSCTPCARRQWA